MGENLEVDRLVTLICGTCSCLTICQETGGVIAATHWLA